MGRQKEICGELPSCLRHTAKCAAAVEFCEPAQKTKFMEGL